MSQTAVVKSAVRAYKRRKLEELAGEVEQAVSRVEARATYAMVRRLAPGNPELQYARKMDQQHGATMVPIGARRGALVTIFGAEPLSLETEPQLPKAKTWIPPETPVKYKAEDA